MDSRVDDRKEGGGTRVKRQRRVTSEEKSESETVFPVGCDCFDDILEGRVCGVVKNSWLHDIRPISSNIDAEDSTSAVDLSLSITSISQQLVQVKRKLWPAAEKCAKATGVWSSPHKEFEQARRWCNPMEPLGEANTRGLNQMFMNRSAIKLANIDAMMDFCLTQRGVDGHEPFLFVDLCAAPGGFSEYLVKRSESTQVAGSCRGYGMSLTGRNEHGMGTTMKLDHTSYSNGSFHTTYRVCTGSDGTGDIYKWENVESLAQEVQRDLHASGITYSSKVQLVVADGGFDAQRDSECQEELAQKLVLCEMAAGIYLLRVGGTMMIKMFGFQNSSIRTAMQSLFDMFEELRVLKPISSRPASAERYVLFTGFRGLPSDWNGTSWLTSVLLGTTAATTPHNHVNLNRFLDQKEMDLLVLNLKACFAILSTLTRKTARSCSEQSDEDDCIEERPPVNTNAYRAAWRLC